MSVGGVGATGSAGWDPEPRDADGEAMGSASAAGAAGATGEMAGSVRRDLPDARARHLLFRMETETSHDPILPEWLRLIDGAGNVKKLARSALGDGHVSEEEVLALVREAEDYFDIRPAETRALERLLDEHGDRFDPSARMALAEFLQIKRPGT